MWKESRIFRETADKMQLIHPEEKGEVHAEKFIKKLTKQGILIFLTAIIFTGLFIYAGKADSENLADNTLIRNPIGGDSYESNMVADIGEESYPITITVNPKSMTDKESAELFLAAEKEIDEVILGDNESAEEIRHDLYLPDSLQEGLIAVTWTFDNYELIDSEGRLLDVVEEGESELLLVNALMEIGDRSCEYSFYLKIYPKELSAEESILKALREAVSLSDANSDKDDFLILPDIAGDMSVSWSKEKEYKGLKVFSLLISVGCLYLYHSFHEVKNKSQTRDAELLRDYPKLVNEISLLMGAGMTVKGAWNRICDVHENDEPKAYIYREIKVTRLEVEKGMREDKALEEFGKRCKASCFMKLSGLLSQNIKKGGQGLTEALDREVYEAFEERKATALRLGEEAGTKLLLPMGILLIVVLVIVVVPGFFSI